MEPLNAALHSMKSALQVLDDEGAPADIGAHLDLAMSRLAEFIDEAGSQSSLQLTDTPNH